MSQDNNDKWVDAYDWILDHVHKAIEHHDNDTPSNHHIIDDAIEKFAELEELTKEETAKIGQYIKRDIHDLGNHLGQKDSELAEWLQFDIQQIESRLIDALISIADKTRIELTQWSHDEPRPSYHTGEITSPGTLTCTSCGHPMQFKKTGRIPPCPKCKKTDFSRNHTT